MVERLTRTSGGMASYFHVGIIVPDLSAAMAHYQDMLGIRFTEPAQREGPECLWLACDSQWEEKP